MAHNRAPRATIKPKPSPTPSALIVIASIRNCSRMLARRAQRLHVATRQPQRFLTHFAEVFDGLLFAFDHDVAQAHLA